jgi:hypothetical protein
MTTLQRIVAPPSACGECFGNHRLFEERSLCSPTLHVEVESTSAQGRRALEQYVTLLHCVTQYPAPPEAINLRAMDSMAPVREFRSKLCTQRSPEKHRPIRLSDFGSSNVPPILPATH